MGISSDGQRFHKIRSLKVSGGFLDEMEIDFDTRLNCIIGGRGTGKTTIVEFLRYALNAMPDPRKAQAEFKQIEK